ncbi:hypothetical protein [Okeania sp. SIO2B3]|uniref:hypothetical protein n=1 Tax=Okeania sp. SIO2B3 TaxID=2607784 RepID=UPI0013BF52AC|nr:hypothetical protein [Okeania sp. SIO2B3]NET40597.1 hypothetical protein [Okeania sp. SIO2B3]
MTETETDYLISKIKKELPKILKDETLSVNISSPFFAEVMGEHIRQAIHENKANLHHLIVDIYKELVIKIWQSEQDLTSEEIKIQLQRAFRFSQLTVEVCQESFNSLGV